jgi:glucose-1-phosphatase
MNLLSKQQYKSIIFDLGGVIINLDYQRTANAFKSLGAIDFDAIYSQKKQEFLFDHFEKGTISDDEFRQQIRKYLKPGVIDKEIDDAWNAMLLDIPEYRIKALSEFKKNYRIFLLSNTNAIHVKAFTGILETEYGPSTFEKIFEKVYYSCALKMRKPDAEIFEMVLRQNDLNPSETIFIDDSPQHVDGAKKTGIAAYLLKQKVEFTDLINAISVL